MKLDQALAELRRLGMHLDPGVAASAAAERRVALNTRTYPMTRALGFHLLIAAVVFHNTVRYGVGSWGPTLLFIVVAEVYVIGSWLALRRWFLAMPRIRGWDLSDLMFVADLVVWAGAIHVTGGSQSLLWIVPLLRVADHRAGRNVWVFAHLAPLSYVAAVVWATPEALSDPPPGSGAWETDAMKAIFLYVAGIYIAWTGIPARRFRQQREAALAAAAGLLSELTDRTELLDHAKRSRSALVERLDTGIRTSLTEIVGFSRFLLRTGSPHTPSERSVLERIHDGSRDVLRALDELASGAGPPVWPRVSLNAILREAAEEERADAAEGAEPARLDLPDPRVEIRVDPTHLRTLFRHLIAAGRHFQGGPPLLEVQLDRGTSLPAAVVMTCAARVAAAEPADGIFNPFAESVAGDQEEMGARLELSMARSIGQSLGFDIRVEAGAGGTRVEICMR